LLRTAGERTQNGKTIVVRLQHVDGGALVSVEDPGEVSESAISPVVRCFAELQGGWIKAESLDGGGAAFRVFLPDGAGTGATTTTPALQITVDEVETEPDGEVWEAEAAHQTLAAELRRVALQSDGKS
jgi:hypothetical protein